MSIQFPNLGINLDYVGKSIQIFGFEITFFGLVIALGMLLGMGFVILEAKRCGENKDDYLEMKAGYLAELDAISAEIGEVQKTIDLYAADYAGDEEMAAAFSKYIGVESISRELVITFIKKITCFSKTRFEIEYSFGDEVQDLLKLIEQRGADVG